MKKKEFLMLSLTISMIFFMSQKSFSQQHFNVDPPWKHLGNVHRNDIISFPIEITDYYSDSYTYDISFSGEYWAVATPSEITVTGQAVIVTISGTIPPDAFYGDHMFTINIQDKDHSSNFGQAIVDYTVKQSKTSYHEKTNLIYSDWANHRSLQLFKIS